MRQEDRIKIAKLVFDEQKKWLAIFFMVITGIFGTGLFQIYGNLRDVVEQRIAKQFEEPEIRMILREVASDEAKKIILSEVEPEADRFQKNLRQMELNFSTQYDILNSQINLLKSRNDITTLGNDAIVNSSRSALDSLLETYKDKNSRIELREAALAEVMRVKAFYVSGERYKSGEINATIRGKVYEENDIPTKFLIEQLSSNENDKIRVRAARLLGKRKEKNVPDALINAIKKENNLTVIKSALKAFDSVTGYDNPDILGIDYANDWWTQNMIEVQKELIDEITE